MKPKISVIIACYNNEETIRAAVDSVLNQTLDNIEIVVVDDCSTDNSREVVEAIVEEHPTVKFVSTPQNSGCVATPRNTALPYITGEYVQFLDGDDTIDINACFNLYWNAVQHKADVCTGHIVREQVANGKRVGWHRWLFKESKTIMGADEFPDLVYDSTATNKIYKVEFLEKHGLKFTEGVYFEDIEFTSKVYSVASTIRMIPDEVYTWKVYPAEKRLTMTADWKNIKSYHDRIRAFLSAHAAYIANNENEIANKLVEKTLKHDLWLFLDQAIEAKDNGTIIKLWTEALPVLDFATPEILANVPMRQRFMIASLLAGDLDALRHAQKITNSNTFVGSIESGHWLAPGWEAKSIDYDLISKYTEVKPHEYHDLINTKKNWSHIATKILTTGPSVEIFGQTNDSLSVFDRSFPIQVIARIRRHGDDYTEVIRGEFYKWVGAEAQWKIEISDLQNQSWIRNSQWSIELCLIQGERVAQAHIKSPKNFKTVYFVPENSGILSFTRDRLGLFTDKGFIFIKRAAREKAMALPSKALSTLERKQNEVKQKILSRFSKDDQVRLVAGLNRRLPLNKNLVLVESHMGKQYSDSPRAIAEALRAANPDVKIVWSFANKFFANNCEEDAVVRHSFKYIALQARAAVVIDNQGFPGYFKRRSGQQYLQTWHGVPLKAMGKDAPFKSAAELATMKKSVQNWSYTFAPTEYYNLRLNKAMQYKGAAVKAMLPRNEALLNYSEEYVNILKKNYGLSENIRYVLWAPTFRESAQSKTNYGFDFSQWVQGLPDDVHLLVRPHYLTKLTIPAWAKNRVIDVSSVQDVATLYMIADVLITDYSSVMFDYAYTQKPIVIFAHDYAEYRDNQRGLNFDLSSEAPGAFAQTMPELVQAVAESLETKEPGKRYFEFLEKYCGVNLPSGIEAAVGSIQRWINE